MNFHANVWQGKTTAESFIQNPLLFHDFAHTFSTEWNTWKASNERLKIYCILADFDARKTTITSLFRPTSSDNMALQKQTPTIIKSRILSEMFFRTVFIISCRWTKKMYFKTISCLFWNFFQEKKMNWVVLTLRAFRGRGIGKISCKVMLFTISSIVINGREQGDHPMLIPSLEVSLMPTYPC